MIASRLLKPFTLDIRRRIVFRSLVTSSPKNSSKISESSRQLANFDPNNYDVPLRPITMDDAMEPYGSWKTAYEAERKSGNKTLLFGAFCFASSIVILIESGVFDAAIMPNLDNIMEETQPFDFDKEGRVTV